MRESSKKLEEKPLWSQDKLISFMLLQINCGVFKASFNFTRDEILVVVTEQLVEMEFS